VGLSIRATVDVRNRNGALVAAHNETSPDNHTEVFDDGESEADALVEKIITSNNAPATYAEGVAVVTAKR